MDDIIEVTGEDVATNQQLRVSVLIALRELFLRGGDEKNWAQLCLPPATYLRAASDAEFARIMLALRVVLYVARVNVDTHGTNRAVGELITCDTSGARLVARFRVDDTVGF